MVRFVGSCTRSGDASALSPTVLLLVVIINISSLE